MQETSQAPAILYKFLGVETHHFGALESLTIRFTQPADLNDIFDCAIDLVGDDSDLKKNAKAVFDRNRASSQENTPPEPRQAAEVKFIRDFIDRQKDSDYRKMVVERFERNLDNMVVLSLTEDPLSPALWGLYSNNATGFVIGLRSSSSPLSRRDSDIGAREGVIRRVEYVDEPTKVRIGEWKLPEDLPYRKYSDWSYEKEWRIMRDGAKCDQVGKKDRFKLWKIDPQAVESVIVGPRSSMETEQRLATALSGNSDLGHVRLLKAVRVVGSRKLQLVDRANRDLDAS